MALRQEELVTVKNPHSEIHESSQTVWNGKRTESRPSKWSRFTKDEYLWTWKTTDISQSYIVSARHDQILWAVPRATLWLLKVVICYVNCSLYRPLSEWRAKYHENWRQPDWTDVLYQLLNRRFMCIYLPSPDVAPPIWVLQKVGKGRQDKEGSGLRMSWIRGGG